MSQEETPKRRAFDNWQVAGPWPRIAGFVLDTFLVMGLVGAFFYFTEQPFIFKKTLFFGVLTFWIWDGLWFSLVGTTPGRKLFKISVHSPRTEGAPTPAQVCLRILTFWISVSLLFIGLTPILFRRDRRGWHDLISETLTIGPEKNPPMPLTQKVAHFVLMLQSLVVFFVAAVMLLFSGTGRLLIQSEKDLVCDSRDLLLNNTDEVLVSIALSPAWHKCVPQIMANLGPLSDSQLGRAVHLSKKYHELWSLSKEQRSDFYQNEIIPLEDHICEGVKSFEDTCKTARHLASVAAQTESSYSDVSWLKEYASLVSSVSREEGGHARITVLKAALEQCSSSIVRSAIQDRLWTEQVALGLRPEARRPASLNPEWNHEQECYSDSLNITAFGTCSK